MDECILVKNAYLKKNVNVTHGFNKNERVKLDSSTAPRKVLHLLCCKNFAVRLVVWLGS